MSADPRHGGLPGARRRDGWREIREYRPSASALGFSQSCRCDRSEDPPRLLSADTQLVSEPRRYRAAAPRTGLDDCSVSAISRGVSVAAVRRFIVIRLVKGRGGKEGVG